MKIYILTDSEGSACVTREKDAKNVYGPWQGEFIREQLTRETAAAVEGAKEAGATEILVHDAGFIRGFSPAGQTLIHENLPKGIKIAMGTAPIHEVVKTGFDAAILLGHHAMAGTADGVMAHTFSCATIKNMWLNGRKIGEIVLESLILGEFDIPVVMVSADEAGCREAKEFLGNIETAPTKKGLNIHGAISLHPDDACDLIRQKTTAALNRIQDFKPYKITPPYELKTTCFTAEQAQARCKRKNGMMLDEKSFIIKSKHSYDLI